MESSINEQFNHNSKQWAIIEMPSGIRVTGQYDKDSDILKDGHMYGKLSANNAKILNVYPTKKIYEQDIPNHSDVVGLLRDIEFGGPIVICRINKHFRIELENRMRNNNRLPWGGKTLVKAEKVGLVKKVQINSETFQYVKV